MHPVIFIAFVLSGFSSLTLEIIWVRYLEHIFGATTLAVSTVLTCFMGGLALGSYLFGRFADRLKSPIVTYGVVEGIVGLCTVVIPLVVQYLYPPLNTWMSHHLGNNFMAFSTFRFVAVALVLIVPTTCMGATLPLLSRHFMRQKGQMSSVGQRIGLLYTLNTLGAVLGVFGATFILLKNVGLWTTNLIAGGINLTLCLAIIGLRHRLDAAVEGADEGDDDETTALKSILHLAPVAPLPTGVGTTWMVVFAFFLSGVASMNLQVVWNRAMAMVIGSSVYSFALVLLAFLIGLSAGSALFSKLSLKMKNPVLVLAIVEFAIAFMALGSYLFIDDLPHLFASLVTGNVDAYEEHVGLVQFIMFLVASLAVFPVTIGMGATFPLTIKAVSRSIDKVGQDVGRVYAINTLGAIIGSFLSAFVFVPLFSRYAGGAGMQVTYFFSVAVYGVAGLGLLLLAPGMAGMRRLAVGGMLAGLLAVTMLFVPRWDLAKLTIGVFRLSLMEDALNEESWGEPDIRYYYDGVTTTVSVEMWGRHVALKNNGKVDASNGDDMPTQIMVAAYPLLLHPKGPADLDVAIVGFGSGVTVGAALEFPVSKVDCVELERAVIDASRVFGRNETDPVDPEFNVNHLIYRNQDSPDYRWSDPATMVINSRLNLFANDGRNFLATRQKTYDVIISEPSNPWITGVSNMFTRDSFASSGRALKPGGIFGQWVQLYEMSPENIKIILRTFADVFPYVALFSAEDLSSDTILLGSFSPIEFNISKLERWLKNERIKKELERAYIFNATDLLGRVLLVNREEVLEYTNGPAGERAQGMVINTDDNAHIEFAAPRDLISYRKFAGYLATIYTSDWPFGRLDGAVSGLGEGAKSAVKLADLAVSLLMNGRKLEAARFVKKAARRDKSQPAVVRAARMTALLTGRMKAAPPVFEPPVPSPRMDPTSKRRLLSETSKIVDSVERGAVRLALGQFLNLPDQLWRRGGSPLLYLKGVLHFLNADPADSTECKDAISVLTELARTDEPFVSRHPDVYYYLGLCHDNDLNFDKAVKYTRTYVKLMMAKEERERVVQAQHKANLEAALSGSKGTALIELPVPDGAGRATDGAGETNKEPTIFSASPADG